MTINNFLGSNLTTSNVYLLLFFGRHFRLPLPLFCLRRLVFDKKIQPGKKSSVQVGLQIFATNKTLILKSNNHRSRSETEDSNT